MKDTGNLTKTTGSFRDLCKGDWRIAQPFSSSGHSSLCAPHEHCAALNEGKEEGNYGISSCEESRRERLTRLSNHPY